MSTEFLEPDFIQIPFILVKDKELEQVDRLLYGIIYWFEHLRDGRCFASNDTLAKILGTTSRVIQNSLTNLEKRGYIAREYKDAAKRNRTDIRSLIAFKLLSPTGDRRKTNDPQVTRERPTGDRASDPQVTRIRKDNKKIEKEVGAEAQSAPPTGLSTEILGEEEMTPAEYARRFFDGDKEIIGEIGKACTDAGLPQQFVVNEMIKFKNYWIERTASGKKQRWQTERTFEVKLRLGTWLRRAATDVRSGRTGAKAGAGQTV